MGRGNLPGNAMGSSRSAEAINLIYPSGAPDGVVGVSVGVGLAVMTQGVSVGVGLAVMTQGVCVGPGVAVMTQGVCVGPGVAVMM